MKELSRPAIERVLRGISTDHVETVRDAWRDMLVDREASAEDVLLRLSSTAWVENPRGPLAKYFGMLLAILDELDRPSFEEEVARLRQSNLHPFHVMTLDVLSRRVSNQPETEVGAGIPVYVARDVADRAIVCKNIERWSKTRGLSLDGVTRIDVIARHPLLDYLGVYNLFFSGIVLTWPGAPVRVTRLWLERLSAEFTFYHEVGHHVCGHREGGTVAEQEDEADEYARSMMRRSRPVLATTGKMLIWLFKPLLKKMTGAPRRSKAEKT